ncbi:MAG TPA: hypothetical protein VL049_21565 [Candidatus Dormibacteraeota bacterium]|nr:hypothetical protein [Candidatus Dormibacteraeota bacterium]
MRREASGAVRSRPRALLVALAVLGLATSAPALVITGGPTYTLPGDFDTGVCRETTYATALRNSPSYFKANERSTDARQSSRWR